MSSSDLSLSKPALRIQPVTRSDLAEVARIHVKSWQQAYVGQVPQAHLDGLDIAVRQRKWEALLQEPSAKHTRVYLARLGEKAVGFVCFGPGRDQNLPVAGEIYALYVLQDAWRQAVGYQLFQTARQMLVAEGFHECYLWVLETNLFAQQAYTRWGGMIVRDDIKDGEIAGQPVREVLVRFQDLRRL